MADVFLRRALLHTTWVIKITVLFNDMIIIPCARVDIFLLFQSGIYYYFRGNLFFKLKPS